MTDALLLDTCAILWLASGNSALSDAAWSAMSEASILYVSPISAWEIAVKADKGKIQLPCPAREWFNAVVKRYELEVLRMTADEMLLSTELPWHHRDPADRFIIATALKNGFRVVTGDSNFPKYGVQVIG